MVTLPREEILKITIDLGKQLHINISHITDHGKLVEVGESPEHTGDLTKVHMTKMHHSPIQLALIRADKTHQTRLVHLT